MIFFTFYFHFYVVCYLCVKCTSHSFDRKKILLITSHKIKVVAGYLSTLSPQKKTTPLFTPGFPHQIYSPPPLPFPCSIEIGLKRHGHYLWNSSKRVHVLRIIMYSVNLNDKLKIKK